MDGPNTGSREGFLLFFIFLSAKVEEVEMRGVELVVICKHTAQCR